MDLLAYPYTLLASADEGQGARLFDHFDDALHLLLGLAARGEIAQPADDLARPHGLLGGLVHRILDGRPLRMHRHSPRAGGSLSYNWRSPSAADSAHARDRRPSRPWPGDGRHAASSACSSCSFATFSCRSVRSRTKPVKLRRPAPLHLADGEMHRKGRAVLPLARHHPADADDPSLAGALVALHIAVMPAMIGLRHQNMHIGAQDLVRTPAKQSFGRRAEGLDAPLLVDDDHRVGHGLENEAQMLLAAPAARASICFCSAISRTMPMIFADRLASACAPPWPQTPPFARSQRIDPSACCRRNRISRLPLRSAGATPLRTSLRSLGSSRAVKFGKPEAGEMRLARRPTGRIDPMDHFCRKIPFECAAAAAYRSRRADAASATALAATIVIESRSCPDWTWAWRVRILPENVAAIQAYDATSIFIRETPPGSRSRTRGQSTSPR